MAKRPPTQKEIQRQKRQRAGRSETITVLNRSRQVISINCKHPPGSDFFLGSQDVRLYPGRRATLPKSRLWSSQIERLQKRGMLSIISDSEVVKEKKDQARRKKQQRERDLAQAKKAKEAEEEPKSEEPETEADPLIVITPNGDDKEDDADNK